MERPLRTLLFDLDGCLYPASNGYEKQIRQNLFKWMNERLGVPLEEAPDLWRKHFRVTNQTLKALHQAGFQFDLDDYFLSTRAGSEQYLQPDPEVRAFLQELPQEKWVFTNADEGSAGTALKLLGLDDCFKGVYGARFMGPGTCCKPDKEAFEKVLHAVGADATTTAFFEDSTRNLRAAKRLGLTTILVQGPTMQEENLDEEELASFVDAVIPAPYSAHLRQALPRLFET